MLQKVEKPSNVAKIWGKCGKTFFTMIWKRKFFTVQGVKYYQKILIVTIMTSVYHCGINMNIY